MSQTKQISLFQESRGVVEIKKHSALVAMNNVTTLQQRKAMNSLLLIAKDQLKRDPNRRLFTSDIGLIKRLSGIGRNDNTELKQGLKGMVSLVIEYNILHKNKHERGAFPFLSFVKIEGEQRGNPSTMSYELPSPILEAVKDPDMYVKLDAFILRGMESKYSLALYETLKDYQNLGEIRIEINDLRKLMGVKEGKYTIFTMFKKRALEVAVDEINTKTDLHVTFELERKGRKIIAVCFSVSGMYSLPSKEATNKEVVEKLTFFGIKETQIKKLLAHHDEDYILANIGIVEQELEKGKQIKNIPAYLMKAFEVDFRPAVTEFEKQKQLKKEQKKLADEQEKNHLKVLKEQYNKERNQKIEVHLGSLSQSEAEELKTTFLAEVENSDFIQKIYKKKGFEYHAIQSARYKFIGNRVLPHKLMTFENFRAIQDVDVEILD